jgi:putative ABC transport system permease protein
MVKFYYLIPLFFAILSIILSHKFSHKLEKQFFTAYIRVAIQLLLLAFFLQWIFTIQNLWLNISVILIMTVNAALVTQGRIKEQYAKKFLHQMTTLVFVLWPMCLIGSVTLYQNKFLDTQILIPFFGLLLGNSLNTLSLGIDFYTSELHKNRDSVLALIGIGATVQEATQELFNRSLRISLNGNLNAMISMGIVSIPGVMTGQMLAGTSPIEAAIVQIITMFFVLSGSYLGILLSLTTIQKKYFTTKGEICF